MALLKRGALQRNDWIFLADGEELPATGPVSVSLERWKRQRDELIARGGALGVRLRNDQSVLELASDAARLDLIEIEFPKFTDGRAFSQARQLREELRYRGELRAVGTILRDQYLFMIRCGIDSVELADAIAIDGYLAALREFSVWYQPAADERLPAFILRGRAANRNVSGGALGLPSGVAASPTLI